MRVGITSTAIEGILMEIKVKLQDLRFVLMATQNCSVFKRASSRGKK